MEEQEDFPDEPAAYRVIITYSVLQVGKGTAINKYKQSTTYSAVDILCIDHQGTNMLCSACVRWY